MMRTRETAQLPRELRTPNREIPMPCRDEEARECSSRDFQYTGSRSEAGSSNETLPRGIRRRVLTQHFSKVSEETPQKNGRRKLQRAGKWVLKAGLVMLGFEVVFSTLGAILGALYASLLVFSEATKIAVTGVAAYVGSWVGTVVGAAFVFRIRGKL